MCLSSHVLVVKRRQPRLLPARRMLLPTLLFLRAVLTHGARGNHRAPGAAKPDRWGAASRSQGVKNRNRLTDGLYSNEGDEWLTDVTSPFLVSAILCGIRPWAARARFAVP